MIDYDLIEAVEKHNIDGIRKAINNGADVNSKNRDGDTPLHLTIYNNYERIIEVVQALIEHGADVNDRNKDGETPLHLHSSRGNIEVVQALIEHGADVNARNENGRTPRDLADNEIKNAFDELIASKQASNIHQAINTHKEEHKTQRKI